jgi:hypothetical protein
MDQYFGVVEIDHASAMEINRLRDFAVGSIKHFQKLDSAAHALKGETFSQYDEADAAASL